uniref:Uncharacterized protein n=1 Tax=Arundo donax TaxID=35708 RepID=A0A0A8Y9W2_ARUDO
MFNPFFTLLKAVFSIVV